MKDIQNYKTQSLPSRKSVWRNYFSLINRQNNDIVGISVFFEIIPGMERLKQSHSNTWFTNVFYEQSLC